MEKKIMNKILIIVPAYAPAYEYGGVIRAMETLSKSLSLNDSYIDVYTTNSKGRRSLLDIETQKVYKFGKINVTYFNFQGVNYPIHSIQLIKQLKINIKTYKIVYISAVWQILGYVASRICLKNKIPYIIGAHGSFSKTLRKKNHFIKSLYYLLFLKKMIEKSSKIHLTTKNELYEGQDYIKDKKYFIVPNAVDSEKFYRIDKPNLKLSFRLKYNISTDSKLLITVCRPDYKKRNDLIISAIEKLKNENFHFLIVGPDDYGAALYWKELVDEKKLNDKITFSGYLEGEKLLEAYSSSDAFILISDNENFGLVVVEAMLCGLPFILSNDVDVWEYLKDEKVGLVSSLNKENISNSIIKLFKEKDFFIKERNINVAKKLFSPLNVGKMMLNNFEVASKK